MTKASIMTKLQLAIFNTQPPLFLGGVERRILETAKRLQNEANFTVYSGTKAGLRKPQRLDGVTVVPCFSTDKAFPLDNWTFNQTLARHANDISADIYEGHTASAYALLNAFKKRSLKAPFVQTIHGVLADEYAQAILQGDMSLRQKVANMFMWKLAKHEEEAAQEATLVVTISEYSKRRITQLYNVSIQKIRIVPNGVDTERFKPGRDCSLLRRRIHAEGKKTVLFVGRLIPRKGLGYLIEAAKQIVQKRKDTLFIIVGNGPLRNGLETEVTAAGLRAYVIFLGDVSETELAQAYSCCDLFVLPSVQEGQGIVLLEAQASSKPVVAFNTSGATEAMRDGETGLLAKPADSTALAEAILRLLSDNALRERMGARGREFVSNNLSWDITARKMLAVYREAKSMI